MTDGPVQRYPAADGTPLAFREVGTGRPLVLLHGFTSDATATWLAPGHAALLAARGHRVILPDLRAHGDSPGGAGPLPADVLTDDALALVAHLGLEDYDVGGYSLGARTVVRMLARGATPRRAIVAGHGLTLLTGEDDGPLPWFHKVLEAPWRLRPFGSGWRARRRLRSKGADLAALARVLDSAAATPRATLAGLGTPALVVIGDADEGAATGRELAALLPHGQLVVLEGDHMTVVDRPAVLGAAIARFLSAP